jgi:outer membrane protein insertion porin family
VGCQVGSQANPKPRVNCSGVNLQDTNDGMHVRASVGFGLLWDSPLGPIRFDFAWPIMKEAYDRTQWFRFSGGTSF